MLSAQVSYDPTQKFALTAAMSGPIGSMSGGFHRVGSQQGRRWAGIFNARRRGLFDAVASIRPTTDVTVSNTPVNNFCFFQGNTFNAVVPPSFLAGSGFAPQNYMWNLWPRQAGPVGNAQISDFAPDNSNNLLTLGAIPVSVLATPEPSTYLLMLVGLAVVGGARRRRRRTLAT